MNKESIIVAEYDLLVMAIEVDVSTEDNTDIEGLDK